MVCNGRGVAFNQEIVPVLSFANRLQSACLMAPGEDHSIVLLKGKAFILIPVASFLAREPAEMR